MKRDHSSKHATGHEAQVEARAPGNASATTHDRAADAAARRMAGTVEEDDGLIVEDSDPETERLRGELIERVARRERAVLTAITKFDSILRARKAEGTIKKGLWKDGIRERFTEAWADYLTDAVFKFASGVVEAAELAPGLDQAAGLVGKGRALVGDHVAAQQAQAEMNAINSIVFGASATAEKTSAEARDRIKVMFHADVRALVEQPEIPVEQHAIIGKLDALLLEAMRASGTQSVNEELDALRERGNLDDEIDAADRSASNARKQAGVNE